MAIFAVAASLPLLTAPSSARAEEVMRSFEATYEVLPNGDVRVTEEIVWDFDDEDDKHGIFRDLIVRGVCGEPRPNAEQPLTPCPEGKARRWSLREIETYAAEEGGDFEREPYDSERVDDALRLRIGRASVEVSGVRTYRITYFVERTLDEYTGHDELFWNVTGRWPVAILEARVRVVLPPGGDELQARCFQGDPDDSVECESRVSEDGVSLEYEANGPLESGDELTIVAGWDKGLVEVQMPLFDDAPEPQVWFTGDAAEIGGAALAGVLSLAGVGALWMRHGRDRRFKTIYYLTQDPGEESRPVFGGGPQVVVEFLPPDNLRPAQMGVILDEKADPRDVTATIVDLAVHGYLHITEIPKGEGLGKIFSSQDWHLTKVREPDPEVLPYEREIMEGLFETGPQVELSDLKNKFYKHLDDAQDRLYEDAMARHWFPRNPKTTKVIWVVIGLIVAVIGAGIALVTGLAAERAAIGIPIGVAGLLLAMLAPAMPRRSAIGSEALRRVLGFRLYVATAETRQHEFNEQQNIFARYLPYAIVFGCVDKWAKAFEGLDDRVSQETAYWYSGVGAFHVASFSSNLQGFSSSVTSTVQSSPSSSGSGFSGGGAGGGGGGGGGGSW
jgi:uncharacterized membrane protein YgcG